MSELVVFGGTTEGRKLAEFLAEKKVPALICVATEYGESLLTVKEPIRVHTGRLDKAEIKTLLREESPKAVIDATHPYAVQVSQTLRDVCDELELSYLRVNRETRGGDGCICFTDLNTMIDWLNTTSGVIFSTLGAKEAPTLSGVKEFAERVWLRILPLEESLQTARKAGFPARHIMCMQGPFSQELNEAMFRAAGAEILLTKESGAAGGLEEKLAAARACGMTTVLLVRPEEAAGLTLEEIRAEIEGRIG